MDTEPVHTVEYSESSNTSAMNFIQCKATLIREYSRRKDELRKRYRHRQLSDDELLEQYTALVRWYIGTRRDLMADFPEYEWEVDHRTDEDADRLAASEVSALIELRQAGSAALSGGSSVEDSYIQNLYSVLHMGAGGRAGAAGSPAGEEAGSAAPPESFIGRMVRVAYPEDGDSDRHTFWPACVTDYDPLTGQHTLVGRNDRSRSGGFDQYMAAGESEDSEDGYFRTVDRLQDLVWEPLE